MAIILLIKTEDGNLIELPLLNKTILGRSSSSDLKITDAQLSGTHCSFEVNPKGHVLFKDLGSTNGSFLNNSKITETFILINDVVRIGNTLVKIDESRLSKSERLVIGTALPSRETDKTLPIMSENSTQAASGKGEAKDSKKVSTDNKKMIKLNQAHKEKKKVISNWAEADNIIEQEPSSGNTKFLKLKTDKDKKKI